VVEIPWESDFSAARNRALAELTADWILSLDADETLDPAAAGAIPALLAADAAGFQVTIRNYVLSLEDRIWDRPAKPNDFTLPASKAFPAYVEHENVRLFRRDPAIYFVGRVHESVGSRIEEAGKRLGRGNFVIHHFGLAANAETRARKNIFYRELGRQKVGDMPRNAQAHLELGLVEMDNFGDLAEALKCFERACELNPRLGVAWFFAGLTMFRLGRLRDALKCLKQAQERGHATSLVAETIGDAHYNLGEFPQAVRAYQQALKLAPQSALLESKLGLAVVRNGMVEKGMLRIRRAVAQQPASAELHDRLILSLVWLDRVSDAALAAEDKLRAVMPPEPEDFIRAASLWAKLGNWARSAAVLQVGLQVYPGQMALEQGLAELAAEAGEGVHSLVAVLTADSKGIGKD
jgi:predicted Zn-dependent protease